MLPHSLRSAASVLPIRRAGAIACLLALSIGSAACTFGPEKYVRVPRTTTVPSYEKVEKTGDDTYVASMCIREFRPAAGQGPVVYLASAIHIGEPGYYQAIQRHLDAQEVVLLEGVRSEDEEKNKKNKALQKEGMDAYSRIAHAVGLVPQSEGLDYHRAHFRRADLTMEQIRASLERAAKEPGDAGETGRGALQQFDELDETMSGGGFWTSVGMWFLEHNSSMRTDVRMDILRTALGIRPQEEKGPSPAEKCLDSRIINERNDAALAELAKILRAAHQPRSVSIFYGAEHLADMEEKLVRDFHYRPAGSVWLSCLTMHPKAEGVNKEDIAEQLDQWLVPAKDGAQQKDGAQVAPPAMPAAAPAVK